MKTTKVKDLLRLIEDGDRVSIWTNGEVQYEGVARDVPYRLAELWVRDIFGGYCLIGIDTE